jgi:hypothetical protein
MFANGPVLTGFIYNLRPNELTILPFAKSILVKDTDSQGHVLVLGRVREKESTVLEMCQEVEGDPEDPNDRLKILSFTPALYDRASANLRRLAADQVQAIVNG